MIPRWFLRSKFWFTNMFMDEYMSRDAVGIFFAAAVMHVPIYLWGVHMNREVEIHNSHVNYAVEYIPRRNRLAHSMIFEEFETHVEAWRELAKAD
jgi:hypothetical protein